MPYKLITSVASLLVSAALLMMGSGVFSTFVGLRSELEGYPKLVTGAMMSAFYIGMVIGTFRCAPIVNRVGHIRAFAAFAATAAATILVCALFAHPISWILMRAAFGFNIAGLYMVTESWLNARADSGTRATLFSLYMMTSYLAMGGGQFLINAGNPEGSQLFVLGAMLLSLSVVPVAVTHAASPEQVESRPFGLRRLYQISPTAVAGCVVAGLTTGGMYGLGAAFAKDIGMDVSEIALLMGIFVLSGLVLQYPLGRLSDRFDRRTIILLASVAISIASLALVLGARLAHGLVLGGVALFGGLSATTYPLCVAYGNDYIDPGDVVKASGGLILAYGMGAALGPLLSGAAMNAMGPGGLFVVALAVNIAFAAFVLQRRRVRSWAPVMPKDPFVVLPDATSVSGVTDFDPHVEPPPLADSDKVQQGPGPVMGSGAA